MQPSGNYRIVATAAVLLMILVLINCNGGASSSGDGPLYVSRPPVICVESVAPSPGTTYYLDPVNGDNANDGSEVSPWGSLQSVIEANMIETRQYANLPYNGSNPFVTVNPGAPVKAGDTLALMDGFHGEVYLSGAYNEYPITIMAATGHRPTLSRIYLSAVANWHFNGLAVSPSEAPTYVTNTLVFIDSHGWQGPSSNVVVENCELYSVQDSSAWSADDWNTLACNAIQTDADCISLLDNVCLNVNHGITIRGNSTVISGNLVENFAGDGLRGLGNDLDFEYNVIKNCYAVNGNHDDGFQSWSLNGEPARERVVLRGNTFINYEDPSQPYRGTLQGIGCFDGWYVDWVVENNLVVTDHWHGITLKGAINSRIINNTVVDPNDVSPGPPWIMIDPDRSGIPSQGNVIRNNIAAQINPTGNTVTDHNLILTDPDLLFVDPAGLDFYLLPDAVEAIDTGSQDLAPSIDLDGTARPQGSGIDLGCFETY